MFKIKLDLLDSDIHFPIIQAIPIKKEKKQFKKFFKFSLFRRKYKIIKDYLVYSSYLNKFIFIPERFRFDGASVPKIINGLFGSTGVLFYGSLPHDFGYQYHGLFLLDEKSVNNEIHFKSYSKKELDIIFKKLCTQESGMKFASIVATFALTLFGFINWNFHRKNSLKISNEYPHLFF